MVATWTFEPRPEAVPARFDLSLCGFIDFAVYNTTSGSDGQPSFSNGLMTSAGSNLFPVLTSVNGTAQSLSQTDPTAYTHTLSANQNPPFTTPLPSTFGAATFSTSVSTALPRSGTGLGQQIGVSFNSGTFLQSATTMTGGIAAVSFAYLHAGFTNSGGPGSGSYVGVPGAVISATGVLGPTAGSFVEIANQGDITIKDNLGNLIATDSFSIIVGFALNSSLQENTYLYGTGTTSLSAPNPTTGAFSILDSNLFPSVTIPVGGTFSVDSYLTLVSDPGSLIQLGDFSGTQGPLDFGSFVGGPAPANVIPEPLALVQFGTGLFLTAGLWGWRSHGRKRRAARLHLRARASLTALLVLCFCLLAPSLAPAGTITVNDLSQPLRVSSENFTATTLFSIDSVHQLVTFDGTYMSSGGYPGPGQSVTYTVVFVDPDGSDSDATTLTIAGVASSNPPPSTITSVGMFFQGIVTSPINPDPGVVFFIPEPAGWFDVAAYLRGQQAPDVPTDLSVVIAAASVPEPSSLTLCGVAALISLGVALRRRSGVRSTGRLLLDRSRLLKK